MKNLVKKPVFIVSAAVFIAISAGGYFYFTREKAPAYEFVLAKRGDIIQEVSVTGKVKPAESVDLAFEKGGKIAKIYAQVGDRVLVGQKLLSLDDSDISSQLAQYEALLKKEQARLDEIKSGTRAEELQVTQIKVSNAQKSLADANSNLENIKTKADIDLKNLYDDVGDILNDAYYKADDAVNKQVDELFTDDQTVNPKLNFNTSDSEAKTDSEWSRWSAGNELKKIKSNIDNLSSDYLKLDTALSETANSMIIIRDFLGRVSDAVNGAILSQTTITTYKGYVNTGRTNINTAITNINNQQQLIATQKITNQNNISSAQTNVNSSQSALALAEGELILKEAGSSTQQIEAQEALVKQAEANVLNIRVQLAKTILHSPIDGIVSKQDAKIGQSISASTPIISIISNKRFEVEANVAEADIAKINVGDVARITLDAYGNDIIFAAQIIAIDPAATIIEGVATYKTTLQFVEEDERIKSGMTANIDIMSDQKTGVIIIPQRAVFAKNGKKFVKLANGEIKEVEVEAGIRGSEGNIEIVKGISEGDKIITFMK